MTFSQMRKKAIQAVQKRGALLVYPLQNRKEPLSIWSELFPKSKMVWDWNEDSDDRVAHVWSLKEVLSRSRQTIYVKWYQGRATFFAPDVFVNLLSLFESAEQEANFSLESREILEALMNNSPMSTKQIKAAASLEGRLLEPTYNRAMKPLWTHLMIVGFGEFEDSSFPSLGIGATATLFEELWEESKAISSTQALAFLKKRLGEENPFLKFALKQLNLRKAL